MAIHIIERAVAPYNSPTSNIVNKEQYSLYAPTANVNKVGMAGYDPRYFVVREQIVELSAAFLSSLNRNDGIIDGSEENGVLTLVLQNGNTIQINVGNLVNGLVSQEDYNNTIAALDDRVKAIESMPIAEEVSV